MRLSSATTLTTGVVALDNLIVLCLLNHLHLVDTPLPIGSGASTRDSAKADISSGVHLPLGAAIEGRVGGSSMMARAMMSGTMVVTMVLSLLGVEGEGSEQVLSLPAVPPQLASAHGCAEEAQGQCNL